MKQVPVIRSTDIMTETPFFKWLEVEQQQGHSIDRFVDTIKRYTNQVNKPFQNRDDFDHHKSVFNYFWHSMLQVTD